jgi:hypothetical protein
MHDLFALPHKPLFNTSRIVIVLLGTAAADKGRPMKSRFREILWIGTAIIAFPLFLGRVFFPSWLWPKLGAAATILVVLACVVTLAYNKINFGTCFPGAQKGK